MALELNSLGRVFSAGITKAAPSITSTAPVRNNLWGWVRESYAGAWQAGVSIDPMSDLLGNSSVYACVERLSTDIAKLPVNLMQLQPDGTWQLASDASPFWRVLRRPNNYQNIVQFVLMWQISKLLYGNAYAVKRRADARGMVTGLVLIDPRRVTPLVAKDGGVYYSIGGDDLAQTGSGMTLPASEVIHDRGQTLFHPLVGISPIYACALSATQARKIQNNGTKFFENMSRPSGMLTAPGTIDDETAARMKLEFEANFGGTNIGRLLVAGSDLKYEPMTMPAQEAQLIEQLDWTVTDVARAFGGIPLYKISAGPIPTNDNVDAVENQYYAQCLQMPITAFEMCMTEGLEMPAGMKVDVDEEALMRMDIAGLYEALGTAIQKSVLTPNEARLKVNKAPLTGGDTVYLQEQNFSLAALAKRDALPDPWASKKPAAAPALPAPPAPAAPAPEPAPAPAKAIVEDDALRSDAIKDLCNGLIAKFTLATYTEA